MLLVSVPLGVVTTTGPVVAPLGTTVVMKVSLTTVKLLAATPLKVTEVVPDKRWPRIWAGFPVLPVGTTSATNGLRPIFKP